MIPKKLSLQGLYSYQEKLQAIDFERLTQAQLFGIFGATGSGKSSILEAITLVLYGESERLKKSGDDRAYNLMNLKSNRLLIDFEFVAGKEKEHRYRFIAKARRNSKRFEDVSGLQREAFRWENEDWRPISAESAEELIGLSYDNFRRTIIIPQGKFQNFLQLTATKRTRMMKDIFRLEKYELEPQVKQLIHQNELKMTEQQTLLTQLAEAQPERLEALTQNLSQLQAESQQQQKVLTQKEREAQQMEALQALFKERQQQAQQLKTLQAQEPEFAQRRTRLQQYERCLLDFQPLLLRKKEYQEDLDKLERSREAKKEKLQQTQKELPRSQQVLKELREQYLQREQLKEKAGEFEKIISLKGWHLKRKEVADRINNGKQYIKVSQANLQDYQQRIQQLSENIQQARKALPDIDLLMEIQTWHNRWLTSEKEAGQLKARQAEIAEQKAQLEKEKKSLLAQSQLEPAQHRLEIDKLIAILQASEQQLKTQLQQEEKRFQELGIKKGLADVAKNLEAGEPCPLCGSVHHSGGHDLEQVDHEWDGVKKKIEAHQAEIAQVGSLLVQLPALGRQLERLQQAEEGLSQQQEQLEDSRQALRAEFPAEDSGFSDLSQLPENLARFKQQKAAIAEQEKQWELLTKSQGKEVNKLEKYQNGLAELQETFQRYEVEIQTTQRSLRQLSFDSYQGFHDESLLKEADKARREYEELGELFEQAEKHHNQLQSRRDSLQGELESLEKQARSLTQKLAGSVTALNEALSASDFGRVEEVEEILATALNPAAERDALNRFEQQLQQAKSELQASESRLAGKAYQPEAHQQLETEIQELQKKLSELNQQRGGLQQEKERLEAQLKRKKAIQKELEGLQLRAENLNTLRKLFSRSGFVNYVSGIFLQNLCLAANERFQKLSRNALSLEVAPGNHFVVRDYLNDGQARSVKTLSGGQTFQASLSLALALADQVQQQVQARQNFFFIDEGFGSQDKDSLRVIFETLKSLRRENRIVGIISHVEELQQEIDTFLRIQNPDEQGSKIQGSWEE